MRQRTANIWQRSAHELLMALSVLALVFLSFAHQPLNQTEIDRVFLLADGNVPVFCGSKPANDGGSLAHKSCDACRISSGVSLADVDVGIAPCFALVMRVGLANVEAQFTTRFVNIAVRPRAPPLSV